MSKAFTSESHVGPEEELQDIPLLLPEGAKNYMTARGAAAFETELAQLLAERQPHDLSELSADQRGALAKLDRRIRFLQARMELLEIVDIAKHPPDRVLFGARVILKDERGDLRSYQVVGIDEADPEVGKVSWISPIAKALLNHEVGDEVLLQTPGGQDYLDIIKIDYSDS